MPSIRAIDFDQWANDFQAKYQLPQLIRRLVRKTVPLAIKVDFPAYEEIPRPGFDGIVETIESIGYVPAGSSGWELGTGQDPAQKAHDDYKKRTQEIAAAQRKQMAFVFVSPRRWGNKGKQKDVWVTERIAESE